jgi:hypothetical protein
MTLATSSVQFTPLHVTGIGPPVVATGFYMIEPTSAYDDGSGQVLPIPFQVSINGAAVIAQIPVTPLDFKWAWKVTGQFVDQGQLRVFPAEYVRVPLSGSVLAFEDLTRVDPNTLGPVTVLTSGQETRLEAVEAAVAAGAVTGGAPAGTGPAGKIRVSDLSDVTAIGVGVGTAPNQAAAQTVIGTSGGGGSSNLTLGNVTGTALDAGVFNATTADEPMFIFEGDARYTNHPVTQRAIIYVGHTDPGNNGDPVLGGGGMAPRDFWMQVT